LLFWRAFHGSIGTENAAVALFRGKDVAARRALVKDEAIIGGHDLLLFKPAIRAFEGGFEFH
jgi:hypothetical protein